MLTLNGQLMAIFCCVPTRTTTARLHLTSLPLDIVHIIVYAGTVITSCYHVSSPTRGSWCKKTKQNKKQPEHESDDHAGDLVTSVCVTNEKDTAQQRQIWSTSFIVLWCSKIEITDGTGIFGLVRVLWDIIFKIYWQFWQSFFKNALESSYNFNPIEITWRKMVRTVCFKRSQLDVFSP